MKFSGILIKPLDEQHDRDGMVIDPAGVSFDPEQEFVIFREFDYRVPEGVLGHGRIGRDESGAVIVTGELSAPKFPRFLAVGIRGNNLTRQRDAASVITEAEIFAVALTNQHSDPDQPEIEVWE